MVRRFTPEIRILIGCYAALLLIAVLLLPLRIEEILQLIASRQHSVWGFLAWMAKPPGSAPLSYLVQFPFVFALGVSRLGARLPSLLFGLGCCYLFLRLAKSIPLRRPYLALAVFLLLPVQYEAATQGRPFEQALCLLLVATLMFVRLIRAPTLKWSIWYAALLTLCLYTTRYSYLPAIGYLLFLFAFVNRSHERRAIWFALPATAAPALLFVPYYLWARWQVNSTWLSPPLPPDTPSSIYLQALRGLAGGGITGYVLSTILLLGLLAGVWGLFRSTPNRPGAPAALPKNIAIFCLFGGAVSTISVVLVVDLWNRYPFHATQVLWAMPGIVVSGFAALERLTRAAPGRPRTSMRPFWAIGAAALVLLLCVFEDAQYAATVREDLRTETALIPPLLKGDSCVVFVSEGLSPALFLTFQPNLGPRVCGNFFHGRAVLASHAYVTPFQQEDAESFFRGLNFTEISRMRAGGGQIVIMETAENPAQPTLR